MKNFRSGNLTTRTYKDRRLHGTLAANVKHFQEMEETLSKMENFAIEQSRVRLFGFTVVKGSIPAKLVEHRENVELIRQRLNESLAENGSEVRV